MATVSDITNIPYSGLNHIDALLDKGPDWNFFSNSDTNVLYYTFSTASGNEAGKAGQEMFSFAQQAAARTAFTYLQQVTGIEFRETGSGTAAQIHLAKMDLDGQYTTGLCSWQAGYRSYPDGTLVDYTANAYVYLDNANLRHITDNLALGTQGYETLLHELGHAIGLKHPFAESAGDIALPAHEDNTANTIMSYTSAGGWYSAFQPYDIAALNWLYGGDGLRGALGMNGSGARYLTGTAKSETLTGTGFNDIFQGNGGNDMIHGGEGRDTVIFGGNYGNYRFINLANGDLAVIGGEGETTLNQIDVLQFADMSVERANIVASDTTAPGAPVMAVTKNGANFATTGNVLGLSGAAEADAAINVYIGNELIATATADANGLWSATSLALKDGLNYQAYATATDAAGNVSVASNPILFHIDSVAPSVPTVSVALAAGENRPVFTGTGEAGTTIELYRIGDFTKIGSADVGADGKWVLNSQPLPNGNYNVRVVSLDDAGNATSGADTNVPSIAINHNGYQVGTANADTITMSAGSNAVDAGAGLDTVVFSGARANYTVRSEDWGFSVTDANGEVDGLYNVERIKFDDMMMALDINGSAGQIYRLYQAAFDRVPDVGGLSFWINRTDQGDSMLQIAQHFAENQEYIDLYANVSTEEFVDKLYEHVLNREGERGGYNFWVGNLNSGATNRDEVLTAFSESPENQAQVIGSIINGIEYPFPIA